MNVFIFGKSRSGKTNLALGQLLEFWQRGFRIVIFDPNSTKEDNLGIRFLEHAWSRGELARNILIDELGRFNCFWPISIVRKSKKKGLAREAENKFFRDVALELYSSHLVDLKIDDQPAKTHLFQLCLRVWQSTGLPESELLNVFRPYTTTHRVAVNECRDRDAASALHFFCNKMDRMRMDQLTSSERLVAKYNDDPSIKIRLSIPYVESNCKIQVFLGGASKHTTRMIFKTRYLDLILRAKAGTLGNTVVCYEEHQIYG